MKNLILTTVLLVLVLSCKAQVTTVSIYDYNHYGEDNTYYKDTYNDYNHFEGTWMYTNGTTSFKIVLQKTEQLHVQTPFSNYYADFIIGEYVYIENGMELVNSLANLSQNYQNPYEYNIAGTSISKFGDDDCNGCDAPNQIRIKGALNEPNCKAAPSTYFHMRYFTENGEEKLYVQYYSASAIINRGPDFQPLDNCFNHKVPFDDYIFVKQ